MAIKVARIPYLGCEPFYYDMDRRGIQLLNMASNTTAAALRNGEIDSAPVPMTDCLGLDDRFQPIAGFCITAAGSSGASVLHSKVPITELNGSPISIPEEASTSRSLLQILLTLKHGIKPGPFVDSQNDPDSHDALLLVGNQSLRRRRGVRGFPHKYDLAQEWSEWTGLPFVFSRWMVRADMDRADASILEDALYVGQEDWLDNLYKMSGPRDDLLMLPKDVLEHVQSLRFYMGVTEQKSIELFTQHLSSLGLSQG
ncbi:MAG: hypothetical protein IIC99_09575 [Chloroflexi bacterium]|nr:hypothetical protein [Chloroflexota bacterium]